MLRWLSLLFDGRRRSFSKAWRAPPNLFRSWWPMARASDCTSYRACLNLAALAAAESFNCPCDRYQHDEHAAPWRDIAACQHLLLAILRPDAHEVFQELLHTPDNRMKLRRLRSAWPSLGLPKRGML